MDMPKESWANKESQLLKKYRIRCLEQRKRGDLIQPWEDAHDFWASTVNSYVRSHSIRDINGLSALEFPVSSLESKWLRGESPNRANIDHIPRKFTGHQLFNICSDFFSTATT